MKYIVKFGDKYSTGSPSEDGLGLAISADRAKAHVFTDRELATKHAVAWTGDAITAGRPAPRVVKLKEKS